MALSKDIIDQFLAWYFYVTAVISNLSDSLFFKR